MQVKKLRNKGKIIKFGRAKKLRFKKKRNEEEINAIFSFTRINKNSVKKNHSYINIKKKKFFAFVLTATDSFPPKLTRRLPQSSL